VQRDVLESAALDDAFKAAIQDSFTNLVTNLIDGVADADTKFGNAIRAAKQAREIAAEQMGIKLLPRQES
jgi:hypothetical protein